jgi:hypothetical protein
VLNLNLMGIWKYTKALIVSPTEGGRKSELLILPMAMIRS